MQLDKFKFDHNSDKDNWQTLINFKQSQSAIHLPNEENTRYNDYF